MIEYGGIRNETKRLQIATPPIARNRWLCGDDDYDDDAHLSLARSPECDLIIICEFKMRRYSTKQMYTQHAPSAAAAAVAAASRSMNTKNLNELLVKIEKAVGFVFRKTQPMTIIICM